jgi:hypothetical protein
VVLRHTLSQPDHPPADTWVEDQRMGREAPEIRLAPVATVARDPCPMKPPSGARLGRASAFRPNGGHHRLLGVDELDLHPRKGCRQAG